MGLESTTPLLHGLFGLVSEFQKKIDVKKYMNVIDLKTTLSVFLFEGDVGSLIWSYMYIYTVYGSYADTL